MGSKCSIISGDKEPTIGETIQYTTDNKSTWTLTNCENEIVYEGKEGTTTFSYNFTNTNCYELTSSFRFRSCSIYIHPKNRSLEYLPPTNRFKDGKIERAVKNENYPYSSEFPHTLPDLKIPTKRSPMKIEPYIHEAPHLTKTKRVIFMGYVILISILLFEFVWTFDYFKTRYHVRQNLSIMIIISVLISILSLVFIPI